MIAGKPQFRGLAVEEAIASVDTVTTDERDDNDEDGTPVRGGENDD